jgi:hypothetical protein
MTIGLFEAIKTIGQAWAKKLTKLLEQYGLNAMTIALKLIMHCEILSLDESFKGTFFGHVFSKACHYVTIDEKVCKNLIIISIKPSQLYL